MKDAEDKDKIFAELEKHMIQFGKYKQSTKVP
jgi:hypothetical protein